MKSCIRVVSCSVIVGLSTSAANAQSAPPHSTSDGVFTAEQATRGEGFYRASCSRCHGADLQATDPEAANLSGPAFEATWIGTDLQERYDRIYYTMPPNDPSTLDPQAYLDILTYILSFNGVPAGDVELPLDAEVLAEIVIDEPSG
jgi:mono/diheme cytochrome c family protein